MFKKRSEPPIVNTNKIDTILGKDAKLTGEIKTSGLLRIEGNFQGDIECENDLIITETGKVNGKLRAQNAIIGGFYQGNISLEGKLEIKRTGKVIGDIKVGTLVVEDGAFFDGKCEMNGEANDKNLKLIKTDAKLKTNPT
ncbi:MAG: polymer-forming cytoskeletal protein [Thermoanaerobacteraceae bacterium]|nr:polymer-forming cytoskeletal protein [Thermoanaerobacteraceae bacterium]